MVKSHTHSQTQTAQKPYPCGQHLLIQVLQGSTPPPPPLPPPLPPRMVKKGQFINFDCTSWGCLCADGHGLDFSQKGRFFLVFFACVKLSTVCVTFNVFLSVIIFYIRRSASHIWESRCYPHLSWHFSWDNRCWVPEFCGVYRNVFCCHSTEVCLPLLHLPPSEKTRRAWTRNRFKKHLKKPQTNN